eukprot:2440180-Amphidinium_carterae.1
MEMDVEGATSSGSGGEEATGARMPAAPPRLAAAEVAEHYATGYAAYRSGCEHCVAGRDRTATHKPQPEGELPEVEADYAYLGPDGSQ